MASLRPLASYSVLLVTLGVGGCSGGGDHGPHDPPAKVAWKTLECDPLVPQVCLHPFPSNVFTSADEGSPTGRRLALSHKGMPTSYYDIQGDPAAWSTADGFSPGSGMMVHLPGATTTGLPSSADIGRSLDDDCPTVLLDTETGERVPHFAELDLSTSEADKRVLFVRPAVRLVNDRRYIVAVRGVVDDAGAPLSPSKAFAALRDGTPLDSEPSVEDRRPLYTDIFGRLDDAGVDREDLQLAWDFTTASDAYDSGWLVHMRDEGLAKYGDGSPPFEIATVDEDFDPRIAYRIQGTFEVPLYLDVPGPVSVMNLGPDGMPAMNGTASFQFELLIPKKAETTPAPLLQFGHGLLGSHQAVETEYLLQLVDEYGYAIFATDWIGLTGNDQPYIAVILDSGHIENFAGMFARLQQAMLNSLLLMRTVSRGIAADPTYGPLLDPSQRYYYGISLGGIMGALYMSLSTDVVRGGLDVPGMPFGLLLSRSEQFDQFFSIAAQNYRDPRDIQLVLGLVQQLWDRAEPDGFVAHLRDDPFPGTPAHDVLIRDSKGDHSVPTVGAQVLARTLGATHLDTGIRDVWDLPSMPAPQTGTVYLEYDFGLPTEPACGVPVRVCDDPHTEIPTLDVARKQLDHFLRTGEVENDCPGGVCSFPELSGCTADDLTAPDPCEG